MVVFMHSLGSIWQTKANEAGATWVWNTTGIHDGKCTRPRSEVYGQVALGRRAQLELNKQGAIQPSVWITSELKDARIRKLQLIVRAPAASIPTLCLVTVTETLIGRLSDDGWDAGETQLVSHSHWSQRQEIMLLMRPFGWLKGERGTATLVPIGSGFEWRTAQWSRE
jgi:hypothetical protein